MAEMKVQTNGQWRDFVYAQDVPKKILKKEFSHLDPNDVSDGYFKYRGNWYNLVDFMRFGYPGPFGQTDRIGCYDWQGYQGDSAWTGTVISVSPEGEQYRVGSYYS